MSRNKTCTMFYRKMNDLVCASCKIWSHETMFTREFNIMVDRLPDLKHHKKELKRIDWNIVKRLVILLYYDNKAKKTNIAMKCRLSYDNCLLYLNWLEIMDLIKKETNRDGFELISLTDKGIDLYAKLQFVENTFVE